MLKIEGFTKRYGEKVAVNNLNLHIAPGEIYEAVYGASRKAASVLCPESL